MTEEPIAIIGGTGDLGLGLALRWAGAGIPILIGSRDLEKAQHAAQSVSDKLRKNRPSPNVAVTGMTNPDASAAARTVVLTVPFTAQIPILKSIRGSLRDSVVVDATVPLAAGLGGKPTQLLGVWQGSAAEQARLLVPKELPVVAAFHNVSAEFMQDISATLDLDVLVCGDDVAAKRKVFKIIERIAGLRPVDAGPLEMARLVEGITPLLISINRQHKVHHSGIRITGLS